MAYGVYGIFFPDRWVYIGSTISSLQTRHRVHMHALKEGVHDNTKMQELWDKFHTVDIQVLDECKNGEDVNTVRELEQYYVNKYRAEGWKLCNEMEPEIEGAPLSAHVKKKISDGVNRKKKKRQTIFRKYTDVIAGTPKEPTMSETHKKNLALRKEQGW
jgi:GIY-YIG catalytic domain